MIACLRWFGYVFGFGSAFLLAGGAAYCQTQFTSGWCSPAIAHVEGSVEIYTGTGPAKGSSPLHPGMSRRDGEEIFQSTAQDASPVIADVRGNVRIVCNGINPVAVQRLNRELNRLKLSDQARIQAANEWAQKYKDQEASLAEWQVNFRDLPPLRNLIRKASRLLQAGDLEQSGEVLDQLAAAAKNIQEDATSFHAEVTFSRARNLDLQFRLVDALERYQECHQERPNNIKYAFAYAIALHRLGRQDREETIYNEILDSLAQSYQPTSDTLVPSESDIWGAKVLNNLAGLYVATGRFDKLKEDIHGHRPVIIYPHKAMFYWMVQDADFVFARLAMPSLKSSGQRTPELESLVLQNQGEASELAALNNKLIIESELAHQHPEDSDEVDLADLWRISFLQLEDIVSSAREFQKKGRPEFINGDALVSSFEAVMNLSDLVCRQIDVKEFSDLRTSPAPDSIDDLAICTNLPKMTDNYLGAIKSLNVIFIDPVAARRYGSNFRLLAQMKTNVVTQLNAQSPTSTWSSAIEEQASKARCMYLLLAAFNSERYLHDRVSFLRDEAAYYGKMGPSDESANVLTELSEIGSNALEYQTGSTASFRWIMYTN
jgi:tetratricopeptide (TPR) repeat protein